MSDTNKENIRGNGDSINMSGNFGVGFAKDSTVYSHLNINDKTKSDVLDVEDTLQLILEELANKHQSADESVKQYLLKTELKGKIDSNSNFKVRFSKALEAGSDSLVKAFESNPFISVPISVVKAWFFND